MDCSPPGSSVHGILQERILKWVAMPSSRGASQPRDRTHISCLPHWQASQRYAAAAATSLQSCPTLCNPMDCSLPGSSVHGILQVRILEWLAISFSRGASQPRDGNCISCISFTAGGFFTAEPPGKPIINYSHQVIQ